MRKMIANSIIVNPSDLLQGGTTHGIEDRSAYLRSDSAISWSGTALTFTSDIILEIINTASGTTSTHTIASSGNSPVALAANEVLWVLIDRTQSSETVTLKKSSINSVPAQTPSNNSVFILAKRVDVSSTKYLHIPLHKQIINPSDSVRLGSVSASINTGSATAGQILSADGVGGSIFTNSLEILGFGLKTSVATNSLTVTLTQKDGSTDPSSTAPVVVPFKNGADSSGSYLLRSIVAANSFVIGASTTFSFTTAGVGFLYLYLADGQQDGTFATAAPVLAASATLYPDNSVQLVLTNQASASSTAIIGANTSGQITVPIRHIGTLKIQFGASGWTATPTQILLGQKPINGVVSQSVADTPNGYGSTNTSVRKYTNCTTVGNAITYTSSATLGDKWTIIESGIYAISTCGDSKATAAWSIGITKNSGTLNAAPASGDVLDNWGTNSTSTIVGNVSIPAVFLNAGDVIRVQSPGQAITSGAADSVTSTAHFRIVKIGQ